jgi:hypothetical protein
VSASADLAALSISEGELDAALAAMEQAERRLADLPETNGVVLVNEANITYVLLLQGRCEEALPRLASVRRRYAAARGEEAPTTLNASTRECQCLAEVDAAGADAPQCEDVVRRWLEHQPDNKGRFAAENAVARQLWRRGDLEGARAMLVDLERQRRDHPVAEGAAMQLRARVLSDLGAHADAVRLSTAALEQVTAATRFQPAVLTHLLDQIIVLRQAGRSEDAEGVVARARDVARTERQRQRIDEAARTAASPP